MCRTVHLDGNILSTIGELAAAVGRDVLIISGEYDELDDESCLCPVDLESTAAKAGVECQSDSMDAYFIRPGQRYVWTCDLCEQVFGVLDSETHRVSCPKGDGKSMSYQGPQLVRG